MDIITKISGREVLNAKGNPTVEARVFTASGVSAAATVPGGTSRGKYEARDLYDGGRRYRGKGTRLAAANVSGEIAQTLVGMDVCDQPKLDAALCSLDGTANKSRLGANAMLAVSVAAARAAAVSQKRPLYQTLCPRNRPALPEIIATVIAGGEFSTSGLEFEDYLYILHGFDSFADMLETLSELRARLEGMLRARYGSFPVEGGALAPPISSTEEAFATMMAAAQECGCENNITLGLDVAASELWDENSGLYKLSAQRLTPEELFNRYQRLAKVFPLTYIEDPFDQDAFAWHARLTAALPAVQVVGDDLFVSNTRRLREGIEHRSANGLLLKINQIGTVTEALAADAMARRAGMDVIVSLRSEETTDDFIADLATAVSARQIKLGSPVCAERNAKYNRLLEIEQELINKEEEEK